MKDPGPTIAGTPEARFIYEYAKSLAKRLGMAEAAAFGQVLKFDDAMRKATHSKIGMSSLIIKVEDRQDPPKQDEGK